MAKPDTLESVVLLLVYRGIDTIDKMSEELGEPKDRLSGLLDKLEITGYITSYREGWIRRHQKYKLTDQGFRIAFRFKERAENDILRAAELASKGLLNEARTLVKRYISYIRPLTKLGVVNPRVLARMGIDQDI